MDCLQLDQFEFLIGYVTQIADFNHEYYAY